MRSIRMRFWPQPEADFNAALAEPGPKEEAPGQRTAYLYWFDPSELGRKRRLYRMGRRVQDVVLSLAALVVLAPFLGAVALAIWLDSPGASPLFVQQRVGQGGRPFRLWKFRSMVPDAEARLESLLDQNEMDGPAFKIKHDPRITRVGRWIRSTSIDELPQLVNILKGEMSFVGPRPALPREVEQYTRYERQRLYVTPGLTCYWQVQPRRNELSFARWMELDLKYIQEQSFWTDWKLILKTAAAVFRRYGA